MERREQAPSPQAFDLEAVQDDPLWVELEQRARGLSTWSVYGAGPFDCPEPLPPEWVMIDIDAEGMHLAVLLDEMEDEFSLDNDAMHQLWETLRSSCNQRGGDTLAELYVKLKHVQDGGTFNHLGVADASTHEG